ncbi:MAG: ferrochelatase [Betaproteobacteria bacterium]|nr:ferrochelatase [Betaproteobacteria bacterium]
MAACPPETGRAPERIGVLLVNLGTPDAPTRAALKRFLKEFLSDRRVVELSPALWWPILHGVILTRRPARSARKYATIWTAEGSPLKVHADRLTPLLARALASPSDAIRVHSAMRYGHPSIASGLATLAQEGCEKILLAPLYPQYAASATATVFDEAFRVWARMRNMPAVRTIKDFFDHAGYIQALAASVREYWRDHGRPDRLLMSFHGIPRAAVDKGDPYHSQCCESARLLGAALELPADAYDLSFQSRFGSARWLEPSTTGMLARLARQGVRHVDVVCPGFVADCLETLEEIAIEGKATFLNTGGTQFRYIPALNERTEWIAALADIVRENIRGWEPAERDTPPARGETP